MFQRSESTLKIRIAALCGIFIFLQSLFFSFFTIHFFSYMPWLIFSILLSLQFKRSALLVRDFTCFAVLMMLFNFLRGAIYVLYQAFDWTVYYQYIIDFEKIFISSGSLPSLLQHYLATVNHSCWLEHFCVLIYSVHFAFFIVAALIIWFKYPQECWRYRYAFIGCCFTALFLYAFVPTMPPWMAAEKGYIPPVQNIFNIIMQAKFGELIKLVDTNPIAAMPSLHVAFPFMAFLALTHHFHFKKSWPVFIYFLMVVFATIFLGAHYLGDIFAGIVLAALWYYVAYFKLSPKLAYTKEVSNIDVAMQLVFVVMFLLVKVMIQFSILAIIGR